MRSCTAGPARFRRSAQLTSCRLLPGKRGPLSALRRDRLTRRPAPCPDEGLLTAERRFTGYLEDPRDAACFSGDTLLHTDYNPENILFSGRGLWMVDWAWTSRGAGFIDPACALPWLIAAGHSAAQAESWAQTTSGWAQAEPAAIDLFAMAIQRVWREIAAQNPGSCWQARLADAAEMWSTYRTQRSRQPK